VPDKEGVLMTTTTAHPSLEEVLALARQLHPADRVRLVAFLTPELITMLESLSSGMDPGVEVSTREQSGGSNPMSSVADAARSSRIGVTVREIAAQLNALPRADDRFADDLEAAQNSQPLIGSSPWPN
jgi:hypothetical protein